MAIIEITLMESNLEEKGHYYSCYETGKLQRQLYQQ